MVKTALLSPAKDPGALAANLLRLLEDRELRIQLAHRGQQHIQQFTWDRAISAFESVLRKALATTAARRDQTANFRKVL